MADALSVKQLEALRRLTRRGDNWCEAYQVDVAGVTLGRLLSKGLVDAKAPNDMRATRYKINDAGRAALVTT